MLEKKRLEDREKLQDMEQIRRDKEKYESIIQKLQGFPLSYNWNDLRQVITYTRI